MKLIAIWFTQKEATEQVLYLCQLYKAPDGTEVNEQLLQMYANFSMPDHEKLCSGVVDTDNLHDELIMLLNPHLFSAIPNASRKLPAEHPVQIAAILALVQAYVNDLQDYYPSDVTYCMGSYDNHVVTFMHDNNADGFYYQIHQVSAGTSVWAIDPIDEGIIPAELLDTGEVVHHDSEPYISLLMQPEFGPHLDSSFNAFLQEVYAGEIKFAAGPISALSKERVEKYRNRRGLPEMDYEAEGYHSESE